MDFDQLVEYILAYESDTFYAEGIDVTREEAIKIAHRLIERMINHDLDGDRLLNYLNDIRETESEAVEAEEVVPEEEEINLPEEEKDLM